MVKIFMRYKKSNTVSAYASQQDHLIECNFKTCWMSEHKTYLLRKYYNWKSIQAHIGKEGDGSVEDRVDIILVKRMRLFLTFVWLLILQQLVHSLRKKEEEGLFKDHTCIRKSHLLGKFGYSFLFGQNPRIIRVLEDAYAGGRESFNFI